MLVIFSLGGKEKGSLYGRSVHVFCDTISNFFFFFWRFVEFTDERDGIFEQTMCERKDYDERSFR